MRNTIRSTTTAVAMLGVLLGLSGCNAAAGDRAGGNAAADVRVLTFAQSGHGTSPQVAVWADQVRKLSKGTLRIQIKEGWRLGETSFEKGTIEDVARGKVDMAWVGARAFDRVGVKSFQALLAPMLIDSHELQAKVFEVGIPRKMVEDLDPAGVVGIGVLPGPMRKVLGVSKPYVSPKDFTRAVVGMQESGVGEATLEALGATTRNVPSSAKLDGLDAYEQQISSIWGNHYEMRARYVTANLNLWPRPLVLFAGRKALASLSSDQRKALRDAVDKSLPATLDAARAEDEEPVADLCKAGMSFPVASAQDLRGLAAAVQPVYDELNADAETKAHIDSIKVLKAELAVGPDSATCSGQEAGDPGSSSTAEIPDGPYEATFVAGDWREYPEEANPGTFTFTFDDGVATLTEPDGDVGFRRNNL